jgi:hypothetical protein
MRPYLDKTFHEVSEPEDVKQLRKKLGNCKLRYACCDLAATQIIRPELSISLAKALAFDIGQSGQIATVVFLPSG